MKNNNNNKKKKKEADITAVGPKDTDYDPDQTSKGRVWSGTSLYTQACLS